MEKNITPINQLSWKDRLKSYKKHPGSFILLLLVGASAVITVTVLVYLVGYILIHGVPYLRPSLFSLTYNSDNVSMMPTTIMTAIVSPSARPTPSTTAANTPDFAAGTTTVKTLLSCVAPSASAPS